MEQAQNNNKFFGYNNNLMLNNNYLQMQMQNQNMFNNQMQMPNQNMFNNQMQMPNQNMLFNQMQIQMNLMQMQNQMDDEYFDVYDYIKEPKIKIVFIRVLDNQVFKIKIPCSLRKNELYDTAKKYKKYKFSIMQLFHREKFLNDGETPIDNINENDEVRIIEQIHGVDLSYYDSYLSKHKNEKMISVIFKKLDGKIKTINVTMKTSIEELAKIIFSELYIPENERKYFSLRFNGENLIFDDKSTLVEKGIYNGMNIYVIKSGAPELRVRPGKTLEVLIKEKNEIIAKYFAGTLHL